MPVFCRDGKMIHFIHIPKCAGGSIEHLLLSEGWETPAEYNEGVGKHACREEWKKLESRLKSRGEMWEYQFATVRNPYDKLESRYWQNRREFRGRPLVTGLVDDYEVYSRKNLPPVPSAMPQDVNLGFPCYGSVIDFLNRIAYMLFISLRDEGPSVDNNHWLPQHRFVDPDTHLFKLEQVELVLDALRAKGYISEDSELPHLRHKNRASDNIHDPPGPELSLNVPWCSPDIRDIHEKVLEVYGKDFELFGYIPEVTRATS